MASLRRSRTLPTDAAIAKFLYTILKQLDLKSIDWQVVADQLDITNGHAARMRFSRFKQQMEGIPTAPRKPRTATPRQKKTRDKRPTRGDATKDETQPPQPKSEPDGVAEPMEGLELTVKVEPNAELGLTATHEPLGKEEPGEESREVWLGFDTNQGLESGWETSQGSRDFGGSDIPVGTSHAASPLKLAIKAEPVVKLEPYWGD